MKVFFLYSALLFFLPVSYHSMTVVHDDSGKNCRLKIGYWLCIVQSRELCTKRIVFYSDGSNLFFVSFLVCFFFAVIYLVILSSPLFLFLFSLIQFNYSFFRLTLSVSKVIKNFQFFFLLFCFYNSYCMDEIKRYTHRNRKKRASSHPLLCIYIYRMQHYRELQKCIAKK